MTISPEYLAQQKELHKNPNYGVASLQYAPIVLDIVNQTGLNEISDYGAGKQNLKKKLKELGLKKFRYFAYDPAFPEYGTPQPAEIACCIDLLEHIEPLYLNSVLQDLKKITKTIGFFTIHTGPAGKTLPDGRNAHIIQKPSSWWLPQICEHFEVNQLEGTSGGFWLIVVPKAENA